MIARDDRPRPGSSRPRLSLRGTNGNPLALLAKALRVMRDAGWSKAEQDAFAKEATNGDYDHVLSVVMKYLDVD